MAINNTYALLDKEFLKNLDEHHNKEIYAKIISLNWDEEPIEEITGNIVSGSIQMDGSSKTRRTCNLSLVTNKVQLDELNWTLRTKFKLFIGVKNSIDNRYDDIIWFPQGVFVITSISSTYNAQGYTISISGKDKMCLINGDVSGKLFAAHEFSIIYTTHNDGSVSKDYIPIYEIIQQAIHTYAQEPYKNIIINDLNTCGVELLDYVGEDCNLYLFTQIDGDINNPSVTDTNVETGQIVWGTSRNLLASCFDAWIALHGGKSYDLPPFSKTSRSTKPFSELTPGVSYKLLKRIQPTDTNTVAGYRATDITYPGELTIEIGGTITDMLDKIIKMLGEFEYYYDIDGKFIFQRKRIYFNSSWSNAVVDADQTYYESAAIATESTYDFLANNLIESIQNKPKIESIRNDFSIWGHLTGVNNKQLPIHLRYAIDHKPRVYYSLLNGQAYYATQNIILNDESFSSLGQYDWRELIYQMARDNFAARDRIHGLEAALQTLSAAAQAELEYNLNPTAENKTRKDSYAQWCMYHYDYKRLSRVHYNDYYRYDISSKRFVHLQSAVEFDQCKANNEFLYGPDMTKRKLELTTNQINALVEELGYDPYKMQVAEYNLMDDPTYGAAYKNLIQTHLAALQKYVAEATVAELATQVRHLGEWIVAHTPEIDEETGDEINPWDLEHSFGGVIYNHETEKLTFSLSLVDYLQRRYQKVVAEDIAAKLATNINDPVAFEDISREVTYYRSPDLTIYADTLIVSMTGWGERTVRDVVNEAIAICKELLSIVVNPYDDSRNFTKEAALLKQYSEQNYVTIAQNELDRWEDTFKTGYDAYYADMLSFWPLLYRTERAIELYYNDDGTIDTDADGNVQTVTDELDNWAAWVSNGYWNPDYVTFDWNSNEVQFVEPEALFFWLDFCDVDGETPELYEHCVDVIGRRSEALNDDDVKCIYVRDTPGFLFECETWPDVMGQENLAYTRIQLSSYQTNYFRISSQGKSAKEMLDSKLYDHTYFQETITLSAVPIYYLEPNTRITVHDDRSGIHGSYIIKTISLQLQHDGMMSITATKAVDRVI